MKEGKWRLSRTVCGENENDSGSKARISCIILYGVRYGEKSEQVRGKEENSLSLEGKIKADNDDSRDRFITKPAYIFFLGEWK